MTDQTTEDAAFFASNPKRKHLLREATEAEILEAGFQAQHVYVVVRRLQTARVRGSQNIEVVPRAWWPHARCAFSQWQQRQSLSPERVGDSANNCWGGDSRDIR